MRRRTFLGAVGVLAVDAGLGSVLAATQSRFGVDRASMAADRLISAYPEQKSAIAVGDAFLQSAPARPRLQSVVEALMVDLDIPATRLHRMTAADLRARLTARTSDDFQAGRTVQVKGWLLGETETRLCSLAALCAG